MGRSNNEFAKGLFHGSEHDFQPGDMVEPRSDWGTAWASTNKDVAKGYGSKVYEVEPAEDIQRHRGAAKEFGIYHSKIGYRVKGLAE
jgi:hypothetical protein